MKEPTGEKAMTGLKLLFAMICFGNEHDQVSKTAFDEAMSEVEDMKNELEKLREEQ